MEKAQRTDTLFLKVILYEGGWFLCVCYKAFIKGMKLEESYQPRLPSRGMWT